MGELRGLWDEGRAEGFHVTSFPRGHVPTDFERWWGATEPYPVQYAMSFEPYVIMDRTAVPAYDERFRGYGMNKIAHLMEVAASHHKIKAAWTVLPQVFVAAGEHGRSGAWHHAFGARRDPAHAIRVAYIMRAFKRRLLQLYGPDSLPAVAPSSPAAPDTAPPLAPTSLRLPDVGVSEPVPRSTPPSPGPSPRSVPSSTGPPQSHARPFSLPPSALRPRFHTSPRPGPLPVRVRVRARVRVRVAGMRHAKLPPSLSANLNARASLRASASACSSAPRRGSGARVRCGRALPGAAV